MAAQRRILLQFVRRRLLSEPMTLHCWAGWIGAERMMSAAVNIILGSVTSLSVICSLRRTWQELQGLMRDWLRLLPCKLEPAWRHMLWNIFLPRRGREPGVSMTCDPSLLCPFHWWGCRTRMNSDATQKSLHIGAAFSTAVAACGQAGFSLRHFKGWLRNSYGRHAQFCSK